MSDKNKPGPVPERFKIELPFEEAVKAALETPLPQHKAKKKKSGPSKKDRS